MFTKQITYMGALAVVGCDGKCSKAWGINNRPSEQLSDDRELPDHSARRFNQPWKHQR